MIHSNSVSFLYIHAKLYLHVPKTLGGSMGAILSGTLCPSSISLIASSIVISSCIISPFMAKSAVCACMHDIYV